MTTRDISLMLSHSNALWVYALCLTHVYADVNAILLKDFFLLTYLAISFSSHWLTHVTEIFISSLPLDNE